MRRLDLAGKRIGSINVLSFAGINKDGRSTWLCRCDCGNEYVTTAGTLRSAKTCKRCATKKDLKGLRFGKLSTISQHYDEQGRRVWLCRCDCGNEVTFTQTQLLSGKATSCRKCYQHSCKIENGVGIGHTVRGKQFLFDPEFLSLVSSRKWHSSQKGYIVSGKGETRILLHRYVMNAPPNKQIDHINRDKADCRRCNLRLAENAENCANTATYANNLSSGHKNVYRDGGRYRVKIRKGGRLYSFRGYETLAEAVAVANEKRKELFGEFAFYDDYNDVQEASVV